MLSKLQTYRKAIAVLIAGGLSVGALYLPALATVPPEAITAASFGLAAALVYAVPNTVAGFNVVTLATAILDIKTGAAAEAEVAARRAGFVSSFAPGPRHTAAEAPAADHAPPVTPFRGKSQ